MKINTQSERESNNGSWWELELEVLLKRKREKYLERVSEENHKRNSSVGETRKQAQAREEYFRRRRTWLLERKTEIPPRTPVLEVARSMRGGFIFFDN